jgi:hypothetical protein
MNAASMLTTRVKAAAQCRVASGARRFQRREDRRLADEQPSVERVVRIERLADGTHAVAVEPYFRRFGCNPGSVRPPIDAQQRLVRRRHSIDEAAQRQRFEDVIAHHQRERLTIHSVLCSEDGQSVLLVPVVVEVKMQLQSGRSRTLRQRTD